MELRSPFTNLYVRDVPACLDFYVGVLGFEEVFRTPSGDHVELVLDGFRLALSDAEAAYEAHGLERGDGPCGEITFWTDDTAGWFARAVEAGAPVIAAPHEFGAARNLTAWVADPDGNPVHFVQTN